MANGFFITGTDTGIGKTQITLALMSHFKQQGYKVAGMKPVASGATWKNGGLRNDDAELISQECSEPTAYELINPFVFELAVAPHIAAKQMKQPVSLDRIADNYQELVAKNDIVFVEGVGGWRVPLSDELRLVELVQKLDLPVLLVVGFKLGCISHALLTVEAIVSDGAKLCAWVSNHLDEHYLFPEETQASLRSSIKVPYAARLGFQKTRLGKDRLQCLNLSPILSLLQTD